MHSIAHLPPLTSPKGTTTAATTITKKQANKQKELRSRQNSLDCDVSFYSSFRLCSWCCTSSVCLSLISLPPLSLSLCSWCCSSSVCLSMCVCLSLSVCLSVSYLSPSSLTLSSLFLVLEFFCLSVYVCMSVSVCLSVCLLSLSILSHSLFVLGVVVLLSVCLCVYVCLCLSVCLSLISPPSSLTLSLFLVL